MDIRVALLAFAADTVALLLVTGLLVAAAYSSWSPSLLGGWYVEILALLPSVFLGLVAGLLSKSRPLLNATVATLLSWALTLMATLAAAAFFNVAPGLSLQDIPLGYAAPLAIGLLVSHFTFRVRQRSNNSFKADA